MARSLSLHRYRKRMLLYILVALVPFLTISLIINLRFLQTHLSDSSHIANNVAAQAASQLSNLYDMGINLAQSARIHTTLQDEVLSNVKNDENDYQALNRNFLKLLSLINAYTLFDDILDIRFYLPSDLVVPNGTSMMPLDEAAQECWYEEYHLSLNSRRWYLTDRIQNSGKQDAFCCICPIQDPGDFSSTVGYLRVDILRSRVEEILESSMVIEDTNIYLVDRTQGTIWHLGDMEDECPSLSKTSSHTTKIGGKDYLALSYEISSSTMSLYFLVPWMNIASNTLLNYMSQLVLLIIELILLMLVTVLFARSLVASKDNQLKLLNYQINPHFLYNTLDMINWQAIAQNCPEIYRPIQSLSRFYKLTLNHGADLITVREEIEQIRLYLDIQNYRFGNQVAYTMEIAPDIQDCIILHMILQPIVENAVLHGIREKGTPTGTIDIRAHVETGTLVFTLTDDGIGMTKETVRQVLSRDSSKGYGLNNIHQRIRLYYGNRYGLAIDSTPDIGTTVTVTLPFVNKGVIVKE